MSNLPLPRLLCLCFAILVVGFALWIFHPFRQGVTAQFHADHIQLTVVVVSDHHAQGVTLFANENDGLALALLVVLVDERLPLGSQMIAD